MNEENKDNKVGQEQTNSKTETNTTSPVLEPINKEEKKETPASEKVDLKNAVSPLSAASNGEISFKEEERVNDSTSNVISETVIDTDINKEESIEKPQGVIQEVMVQKGTDLDNVSAGENSIFNEKNIKTNTNKTTGMKEGQEKEQDNKVPVFMIIAFIILIVAGFFIDDIYNGVQSFLSGSNKTEEISDESEEEILTLDEIKEAVLSSSNLALFESNNNVEVEVTVTDNILTFKTSNYLNSTSTDLLEVSYTLSDNILTSNCTIDNSSFGLDMSKILIKEIALLNGVTSSSLDTYINDNLYTLTITDGFELTNSEDGNNTYMIATNIKLNVE